MRCPESTVSLRITMSKARISIPGGRNGIDQEVITMPNKQQYTLSEALAMMQYIEGNDDINPFEHSDLLEINEIVEHELKKRGRLKWGEGVEYKDGPQTFQCKRNSTHDITHLPVDSKNKTE